MEWALYSEQGYYQKRVSLGKQGDFFTAAQFSLFGATLAHYAWDAWLSFGEPQNFQVVELGPGQGELAASLLARLRQLLPQTVNLSYVLVEPSLRLRQLQGQRLQGEKDGVRISWQSPDASLDTVVLANEVLDALPVERVRKTAGGWQWAWVTWNRSQLSLQWRPAPAKLSVAATHWLPIPVDTEAEWCWGYEKLFRSSVCYGRRIHSLWMDYGITREELASGLRPQGTVRGFSHHQLVDPLSTPGEADITADVFWDGAADAARQVGYTTRSLVLQGTFLRNAGLLGVALAESIKKSGLQVTGLSHELAGQVRQLVLPGGMGERFKVLECWRD
jgi:SAM-dependent MidA family methyltransferase